MVYIKNWTDFETEATSLYAKSPRKVRYSVKFVPKTGQLVLKLTDDTTCIMYKTFSSIILNRFEALNLRLLSQIANVRPKKQPISISATGRSGTPGDDIDDPMGGGAKPEERVERTSTPVAGGDGGGKKKKKKGKR